MTKGQGEPAQLHCPRCGGAMRKPAGSTLYWHVDNNHPRCDITNITDSVLEMQNQAVEPLAPVPEAPKTRNRRSK